VGRLGWSHVRSGLARSLALLLGMFLAATAFTVLTAASRTAQLRTVGTVSAHFQPAYDILVRPKGARTKLEERAAEFATLRAVGWSEPALSRLVITEGTVIGLTGSLAGAALGLAGAAEFTGQLPVSLCLLAAAACIAGTAITATAAFLPARALNRLPTARLLAEE